MLVMLPLLFFALEAHFSGEKDRKRENISLLEYFKAHPLLIVSLLEVIYIIYSFLFFKTTYNFNAEGSKNHLLAYFQHDNGAEKSLRICPFGRDAIFVLVFALIASNIKPIPRSAAIPFTGLAMLIGESFNNRNVGVYLFPIFLLESFLFLLKSKKKDQKKSADEALSD